MYKFCLLIVLSSIISLSAATQEVSAAAENKDALKNRALATMEKASDFMVNKVSCNGGYLYMYSADLKEQWGEIPAKRSQIIVQTPGTPEMGSTFLGAYKNTGDKDYLAYAEKAANALIWGQSKYGGWHYIIDFDMKNIENWYTGIASKCWGWEEYLHYYGNCTFDDNVTASATKFLLDMYMTNLAPEYREPLLKALSFILESQYPNGAWPQRYPHTGDFPYNGHADYTSYYTFNDDVMANNIYLLLSAYEMLGDDDYMKAAKKGMDFYMASQLPAPQAGWAQQYKNDMTPGWARSYEPDAVCVVQTTDNIRELMNFYKITGDRRFLTGIPAALNWLEQSKRNFDAPYQNCTHAYFYEQKTNKPLWSHRTGSSIEDGKYWVDYSINDFYPYGVPLYIDIDKIRKEYVRVSSLTPEKALEEYERGKVTPTINPSAQDVLVIIDSLNPEGAWITDIKIPLYFYDTIKLSPKTIKGIDTRVFIKNMNILGSYIGAGS